MHHATFAASYRLRAIFRRLCAALANVSPSMDSEETGRYSGKLRCANGV
jgi:hypothetical protein